MLRPSAESDVGFAWIRIAGFWPVIRASSSTAASSSLMFWVASPTPMLTTTLVSRGTAMTEE